MFIHCRLHIAKLMSQNRTLSGLFPSTGKLQNRKHDVSGLRAQLSRCLLPSPEDGNRSSFQIVVFFSILQNTGRWNSPKPSNSPSESFRIYSCMPLNVNCNDKCLKLRFLIRINYSLLATGWTTVWSEFEYR
jgi:hypothetical protein